MNDSKAQDYRVASLARSSEYVAQNSSPSLQRACRPVLNGRSEYRATRCTRPFTDRISLGPAIVRGGFGRSPPSRKEKERRRRPTFQGQGDQQGI